MVELLLIVLLLILCNAFFALSEMSVVTSRKARLKQRAEDSAGARKALELAEHPERLGEIFPTLTKISVDYAVMEPVSRGEGTAHVSAIGLDIEWADVGSYAALHEVLERDAEGTARIGAAISAEGAGNLLINTEADTVVAVYGLSEIVVVRTPRATLVAPLAASQQIKAVAEQVAAEVSEGLA